MRPIDPLDLAKDPSRLSYMCGCSCSCICGGYDLHDNSVGGDAAFDENMAESIDRFPFC